MSIMYKDWVQEAQKRFGTDSNNWKFVCPVCGYVQSVGDCKAAGVPENAIGFSCIGRWKEKSRDAFEGRGKGPCNYAGGGLFRLNPVTVVCPDGKEIGCFEFAPGEKDDGRRQEKMPMDPHQKDNA